MRAGGEDVSVFIILPMTEGGCHEGRDVVAEPLFVHKGEGRVAGPNLCVRHVLPPRVNVEPARRPLLVVGRIVIYGYGLVKGRAVFARHAAEGRSNLVDELAASAFKFGRVVPKDVMTAVVVVVKVGVVGRDLFIQRFSASRLIQWFSSRKIAPTRTRYQTVKADSIRAVLAPGVFE